MTDDELRMLVRAAIARHTTGGTFAHPTATPAMLRPHPSHGMLTVPAGSEMDGPCIIEPAVLCNHCGYCKSYGH